MDLIKLDDSNKAQIKSTISQKLASILGQEDEEDVLPEYVMVMIANQKTKDQVKSDLDAFLGDQSASFTAWLWDMLSSAKNATPTNIKAEPQVIKPPQEVRSVFDTRDNNRREQSPPKSVFASVITVPPPAKRTELDHPAPSRLVLSAVNEAVKSVPPPRTEEVAMEDDVRERKFKTGRRTGNVFDRIGNGDRDSRGRDNDKGHDNRRDRYDRHDRTDSRGRDKYERGSKSEDPVTFTITLNGAEERAKGSTKRQSMESADDTEMGEDSVLLEDEDSEGGKKVKKQKCQYWPNCKRGDSCIYVHPSVQCNLFPNCPYAENCLYIHPAVPCKFGAGCTRADCAFNHPAGAKAAGQKGGAQCKYGFACPRNGCTFAHPPEACRYGESCTRAANCPFGHGKACRFGVTCATPACTFAHYKDIEVPCKFGAKCTNTSCKFQHDKSKEEDDVMVDAAVSGLSATLPPTPPRETVVN